MKGRIIALIVMVASTLGGCSKGVMSSRVKTIDTTNLEELSTLSQDKVGYELGVTESGSMSGIRTQAIKDIATSLGARGGLARRAKFINRNLQTKAVYLDRVFNFRALMLSKHVLPPVLVEGRNTLDLASSQLVHLADRTYKLVRQARFVTNPPHWRNYLGMPYKKPEQPEPSLLPKNRQEQAFWKQCVERGWKQGIGQADVIYRDNLARLKRDYKGMIRYKYLLAQNIVSAPVVVKRELGVTGGGRSMSVNDRTLKIAALPSLKPDSEHWVPVVVGE